VTNITFVFETTPNTKSKEKKVGVHGILCPLILKKWGGTFPESPTKLHPCINQSCSAKGKIAPAVILPKKAK